MVIRVIDRGTLAAVIEDTIEALPHERRLYPDIYAGLVADAVIAHLTGGNDD